MLARTEEAKLERSISETLEGALKGKGLDIKDCTVAAKQVLDLILGDFDLEPKPYIAEAAKILKNALDAPKTGFESLFMSPRDAAGLGGGMGEDR